MGELVADISMVEVGDCMVGGGDRNCSNTARTSFPGVGVVGLTSFCSVLGGGARMLSVEHIDGVGSWYSGRHILLSPSISEERNLDDFGGNIGVKGMVHLYDRALESL